VSSESGQQKARAIKNAKEGKLDTAAAIEIPEVGKDVELQYQIDQLDLHLARQYRIAVDRGRDPKVRALEGGRERYEGDGY
jgi:hypothetical protein